MEPTVSTFAQILSMLSGFGTALMSIWGNVVTFVTTSGNEIALIGIFAFLFVLGVKGIRSLVTGV